MKIQEWEKGYKTSDIYIATAILCEKDMELAGIEKDSERRSALFCLEGDKVKIKKIIDDFFANNHMVSANTYSSQMRKLKTQLYIDYPMYIKKQITKG